MSAAEIGDAARLLDDAQCLVRAVPQLPEGLSLDDAYRIQHALIERRLARGERPVGTKLGFTSKAKMAQMGVSEIIVGQLTDAMEVADDGEVPLGALIHPRIEPELAFRLAADVEPGGDITACVDAVAPALEIIDSRYRDFRFNLADVVADNTSAAGFVVGEWQPIGTSADLGNLDVQLVVDGEVAETGSSAAILGHPLDALRALTPLAYKYAFVLTAGQVVLAGAATAAVPFTASSVEGRVDGLGAVRVRGIDG